MLRSKRAVAEVLYRAILETLEDRRLMAADFTNAVDMPIRNLRYDDSAIAVTGLDGVVSDVNVTVNIDHDEINDVTLRLVNQNTGTAVLLVNQRGGAGDDFTGTTFDDGAGTAINSGAADPPFSGAFKPEEPLSNFIDEDPNGTWLLQVLDSDSNTFEGTLEDWTLSIDTKPAPPPTGLVKQEFTASPNAVIPNGGGQLFPIEVAGVTGRITDLDVTLNIEHDEDNDIYAWLVNRTTGTSTRLVAARGGAGDNFLHSTFDDEALVAVSSGAADPPFTGRFKPEQPLANFNGESANGQWELYVVDDDINTAQGKLLNWTLRITSDPANNPAPTQRTNIYSAEPNLPVRNLLTTESVIDVGNNPGAIRDVDVELTLDHKEDNDIQVTLVHIASGRSVDLVRSRGGAGWNFTRSTFDDEALVAINSGAADPPFIGRFEPEEPLANFNDLSGNGQWKLLVTDNDNNTEEGTLIQWRLRVTTDIPAAPTDVSLTPAVVPENQPAGTVVGVLATVDSNLGDWFSYELIPGEGSADNAVFSIVGGNIVTGSVLDFESRNQYSIRVRSTDPAGLTVEKSIAIAVSDAPDNGAPIDLVLAGTTLAESRPVGTIIGTLTTSDPTPGDTFTYTLVPGAGADDNSLFSVVGDKLTSATAFGSNSAGSYSVRVRSADSTGQSIERVFAVEVTDQPQSPDISVTGPAGPIGAGATINFGTVSEGASPILQTFTVRNDGVAPLQLAQPVLPAGYSLVEALTTTLQTGQSDSFTVQLDSAGAGAKSGSISIASNDPDENPITFGVSGVVDARGISPQIVQVTRPPRVVVGGQKGAKGKCVVRLVNFDASRVSGRVTVEIFAASDMTSSYNPAMATLITKTSKIKINPGRDASVKVSFNFPAPSTSGDYYLKARVTGAGVTQSSGAIVVDTSAFRIEKPTINLVSVGAAPVPTIVLGKKTKLAFTLTNAGNISWKGKLAFDAYLTTGDSLSSGDPWLQRISSKTLKFVPGRNTTVGLSLKLKALPAGILPGNYKLILRPQLPAALAALLGSPLGDVVLPTSV